MKYVVEMGSGAMIYTPSFINIGSGIPKLIGVIHKHTDSMEITFFQNKECKLKLFIPVRNPSLICMTGGLSEQE
jgi:hypothetical protein